MTIIKKLSKKSGAVHLYDSRDFKVYRSWRLFL